MTAALIAEGLHTFYGKSHILHGVSLEVAEGKVTALLGRNGAGKTTTLRSLMGLTPPREGQVTIFGTKTTGMPPFRVAGLGVGYVPEGRKIFPNLTVDENLMVPLVRPGPWTPASIYKLFPRLAERKSNRGRQLSGGEQEMLSIGRALLINPKLLMLDEPSQGLAPLIVREVFRIVAQMRSEGISVLLVEQNVRMSLEIADHAYVLDDGQVVYSGSARELAADDARVQSLAGASAEEWTPHSVPSALYDQRRIKFSCAVRIEPVRGAHVGDDGRILAAGDEAQRGRGDVAAGDLGVDNIGLVAAIGGIGALGVHRCAITDLVRRRHDRKFRPFVFRRPGLPERRRDRVDDDLLLLRREIAQLRRRRGGGRGRGRCRRRGACRGLVGGRRRRAGRKRHARGK